MSKEPLLLGISCLHYEWNSLDEAFNRCVEEFGLELIEFSTGSISEEDYDVCRTLSEKYSVQLGLHAWDNLPAMGQDDGETQALKLLNVCQQMGSKYLILHMGSHPNRKAGIQLITDICARIAPDFEDNNVLLCLENHYPYEYKEQNELGGVPDDFLPLFNLVNSPSIRFCLDYGHSNMADNTDDFIACLHPYLAYTHIADNMGEHDEHLAFGEGTVDWQHVLWATLKTGFRGPYVIEFPELHGIEFFTKFLQTIKELDRNSL
ncbi:TIM barrel protein [bacterium]|nr:TIM barrel protein [bacterium]